MQSEKLIESLSEQTKQIITRVEALKDENWAALTWKEAPDVWNIIECLEHLNLYGDHYLPEIEANIQKAKKESDPEFKSGWLGSYFAKTMLPKQKLNKMKTFKDKNPLNTPLDTQVINRFIAQQTHLIDLLDQANHVNLSKVKIRTSISNRLKFSLGDTFQFYINHIIRHLQQIEGIQAKSGL